jgi:hypothetical protein
MSSTPSPYPIRLTIAIQLLSLPVPQPCGASPLRLCYPSDPCACYVRAMALNATARRRWFGALILLTALAMLICGQTVLLGRLGAVAFVAYWLLCFVLTGLAVLVAFLDARALQRRTRQEQRDLFAATLKDIETEAKTKSGRRSARRREP